MKISLAKIISFVFNPVFVTTFAPFILVLKTTHDLSSAIYWTLYSIVFLLMLGLLAVMGVKKKIFTDFDISKKEQRPLMSFVCIMFALVYLATLFFFDAPYILFVLTIGIILAIFIVLIINKRIKASIHVATITALAFTVAIGYGGYYYFLLFLIPLVAWARLKTKRHTLSEIFTGGAIGGFLSLSLYFAAKFFLNK